MNFKISKRVFYSALNTVSRAISSNSPLPALSGIKIEVNQDSIDRTLRSETSAGCLSWVHRQNSGSIFAA